MFCKTVSTAAGGRMATTENEHLNTIRPPVVLRVLSFVDKVWGKQNIPVLESYFRIICSRDIENSIL